MCRGRNAKVPSSGITRKGRTKGGRKTRASTPIPLVEKQPGSIDTRSHSTSSVFVQSARGDADVIMGIKKFTWVLKRIFVTMDGSAIHSWKYGGAPPRRRSFIARGIRASRFMIPRRFLFLKLLALPFHHRDQSICPRRASKSTTVSLSGRCKSCFIFQCNGKCKRE